MNNLLNFEFLAILNFLVLLFWPASVPYREKPSSVFSIIAIILTVIAVFLDIVFLVLKVAAH
jgi:hypothetical protein